MAKLSLNKAVKVAQKTKKTIQKDLENGVLSGTKNDRGHWEIEESELARVYDLKTTDLEGHQHTTPIDTTSIGAENGMRMKELEHEVELLRERVVHRDATIETLTTDRDEWRKQAQTLALTDQTKARGWWPFRRKSA